MNCVSLLLLLILTAPAQGGEARDPNSRGGKSLRDALGVKVFNNLDKPVTGVWLLEATGMPTRHIEIREQVSGKRRELLGVDTQAGEEIFRLTAKKEGIGYEGTLDNLLDRCGLGTLSVTEFLPLGDSIVFKFEAPATTLPCPPIDSGDAGRYVAVSTGGRPIKLRDFSEISTSNVREQYGIGGERGDTEVAYSMPVDAVSIDPGTELKFLRRVKAPLDSSYWFEMEVVLAPDVGVEPPRGFVTADALRFVGSMTLKRAGKE